MPGRKASKKEDPDVEVLQELQKKSSEGVSVSQWIHAVAFGAIATFAPLFLFASSIFGLEVQTAKMHYAIALVASTILLSIAIIETGKKSIVSFAASRTANATGKDRNKAEEEYNTQLRKHSTFYSLFVVNATFLGLFVFVTFYVLPSFELTAESALLVAVLAPAVISVLLARTSLYV